MGRQGMLITVLALAGCYEPSELPRAPGAILDVSQAVAVDVQSSIGAPPHAAVARAVNELGAAVPSDAQRLTVDGTQQDIDFDAFGYGGITLDAPGSARVTGALREAWVHAAPAWAGPEMMPAHAAPDFALFTARATGGALVAGEHDVWWVAPGEAPHLVLSMPIDAPIAGLRAAHVDADGVLDALVWGGDLVVALRGRPGGGMSHGVAVRAEGFEAVSADAADLTNDGMGDIAIAWRRDGFHHLQVLQGDGLWNFRSSPAHHLAHPPTGLAIGDVRSTRQRSITVLDEEGHWQRFVLAEDAFVETGPRLSELFPPTEVVESGFDVNGDGSHELLFLGPLQSGLPREIRLYNLHGTGATYVRLNHAAAYVGWGDLNGNGQTDLLMLPSDREMLQLSYLDAQYEQSRLLFFPTHAPFTISRALWGDAPDVLLAGPTWTWWAGGLDEDGWWTPEQIPPAQTASQAGTPLATAIRSSTPQVVGFRHTGTTTTLVAWRPESNGVLTVQQSTTLPGTAQGVDLAVCGDVALALTETTLYRVSMTTGTIQRTMPTTGTRVDCGPAPSGGDAVLLVGNEAQVLDATFSVRTTQTVTGAKDVALVDLGDGPSIATCAGDGCMVARWVYGADGAQALVTSDASGVRAQRADGSVVQLADAGRISVADVDGDGAQDLLVAHDQTVLVFRSTGEGFGVAEGFHSTRPIEGVAVPAATGATARRGLVIGEGDGTLTWFAPR